MYMDRVLEAPKSCVHSCRIRSYRLCAEGCFMGSFGHVALVCFSWLSHQAT